MTFTIGIVSFGICLATFLDFASATVILRSTACKVGCALFLRCRNAPFQLSCESTPPHKNLQHMFGTLLAAIPPPLTPPSTLVTGAGADMAVVFCCSGLRFVGRVILLEPKTSDVFSSQAVKHVMCTLMVQGATAPLRLTRHSNKKHVREYDNFIQNTYIYIHIYIHMCVYISSVEAPSKCVFTCI